MVKSCCGVPHAADSQRQAPAGRDVPTPDRDFFETVPIPAGTALVGTNVAVLPQDGERPLRQVKVSSFHATATCITNAMFSGFVEATGYLTDAERLGWSFVFFSQLPEGASDAHAVADAPWWRKIEGASWQRIGGPGSEADWHPDHPVVHVSWNDAHACARWAGGRLPSEAEWEHAARGGLGDVLYPWGDKEPDDDTFQPCNIWQGTFPTDNSCRDSFFATAPAKSFSPNGYGLYNMSGNVWEWTTDPFTIRSVAKSSRERMKQMRGTKILKGGSFLCHRSYCHRYRIAARTGNSPDSTTSHVGFRLIFE